MFFLYLEQPAARLRGAPDFAREFRRKGIEYSLQRRTLNQTAAKKRITSRPCGFSSLAATREWLGTGMAKAFMRAYRKTRIYMNEAPAAGIARAEKPYFPEIDEKVLADCIATYQQLGCWTPHVKISGAIDFPSMNILRVSTL